MRQVKTMGHSALLLLLLSLTPSDGFLETQRQRSRNQNNDLVDRNFFGSIWRKSYEVSREGNRFAREIRSTERDDRDSRLYRQVDNDRRGGRQLDDSVRNDKSTRRLSGAISTDNTRRGSTEMMSRRVDQDRAQLMSRVSNSRHVSANRVREEGQITLAYERHDTTISRQRDSQSTRRNQARQLIRVGPEERRDVRSTDDERIPRQRVSERRSITSARKSSGRSSLQSAATRQLTGRVSDERRNTRSTDRLEKVRRELHTAEARQLTRRVSEERENVRSTGRLSRLLEHDRETRQDSTGSTERLDRQVENEKTRRHVSERRAITDRESTKRSQRNTRSTERLDRQVVNYRMRRQQISERRSTTNSDRESIETSSLLPEAGRELISEDRRSFRSTNRISRQRENDREARQDISERRSVTPSDRESSINVRQVTRGVPDERKNFNRLSRQPEKHRRLIRQLENDRKTSRSIRATERRDRQLANDRTVRRDARATERLNRLSARQINNERVTRQDIRTTEALTRLSARQINDERVTRQAIRATEEHDRQLGNDRTVRATERLNRLSARQINNDRVTRQDIRATEALTRLSTRQLDNDRNTRQDIRVTDERDRQLANDRAVRRDTRATERLNRLSARQIDNERVTRQDIRATEERDRQLGNDRAVRATERLNRLSARQVDNERVTRQDIRATEALTRLSTRQLDNDRNTRQDIRATESLARLSTPLHRETSQVIREDIRATERLNDQLAQRISRKREDQSRRRPLQHDDQRSSTETIKDNRRQTRGVQFLERSRQLTRSRSLGQLEIRVSDRRLTHEQDVSDATRRISADNSRTRRQSSATERRMATSFARVSYIPTLKSSAVFNAAQLVLLSLLLAQVVSNTSKGKKNWFLELTNFVTVTKDKVL